jgi:hypothetical protein
MLTPAFKATDGGSNIPLHNAAINVAPVAKHHTIKAYGGRSKAPRILKSLLISRRESGPQRQSGQWQRLEKYVL